MKRVVIALGSNMPHGQLGKPEQIVRAAAALLAENGLSMIALSPVIRTDPVGPSDRQFANAAILGLWPGSAEELLELCKDVETRIGRRRTRRWGRRVIDCDILLIERDLVDTAGLHVPHLGLTDRLFALEPLVRLWPGWRHPRLNRTARQLLARLKKPRPAISTSAVAYR